jgi:ankyrin repeat protein
MTYIKNALHKAVDKGYREPVKLLIDDGADVNAKNKRGITPIFSTVTHNDVELFLYLVERGADLNISTRNKTTLLHEAAFHSPAILEYLINKGVDVNAKDVHGSTPLHNAMSKKAVELLLAAGADPTVRDNEGLTTLMVMLLGAELGAVELLLQTEVEKTTIDLENETLLHHAAIYRREDLIPLLLAAGVDPNVKDNCGHTYEFYLHNSPLNPDAFGHDDN